MAEIVDLLEGAREGARKPQLAKSCRIQPEELNAYVRFLIAKGLMQNDAQGNVQTTPRGVDLVDKYNMLTGMLPRVGAKRGGVDK